MTKLNVQTRIVAGDYDFESVRAIELSCSKCGAKIPDRTIKRLLSEAEFVYICRQCTHVSKLTRAELDKFADSLTWIIPELEQMC